MLELVGLAVAGVLAVVVAVHLVRFGGMPAQVGMARVVRKTRRAGAITTEGVGAARHTVPQPTRLYITWQLEDGRTCEHEAPSSYFERLREGDVRPVRFAESRLDRTDIRIIDAD